MDLHTNWLIHFYTCEVISCFSCGWFHWCDKQCIRFIVHLSIHASDSILVLVLIGTRTRISCVWAAITLGRTGKVEGAPIAHVSKTCDVYILYDTFFYMIWIYKFIRLSIYLLIYIIYLCIYISVHLSFMDSLIYNFNYSFSLSLSNEFAHVLFISDSLVALHRGKILISFSSFICSTVFIHWLVAISQRRTRKKCDSPRAFMESLTWFSRPIYPFIQSISPSAYVSNYIVKYHYLFSSYSLIQCLLDEAFSIRSRFYLSWSIADSCMINTQTLIYWYPQLSIYLSTYLLTWLYASLKSTLKCMACTIWESIATN